MMRRGLLLVIPALVFNLGCDVLNPAMALRTAAQQLSFSIEKVEPSLHIAFPLEDSRLNLRLIVAVDNPTDVHFKATRMAGRISLSQEGVQQPIGHVSMGQGLDLPQKKRSTMPVDLSFTYRDLKDNWASINAAAKGAKGTWKLDGEMELTALGIPINLPIRASKSSGGK